MAKKSKKLVKAKQGKVIKKTDKKKASGIMKILEVVVLFGAFAAFLVKFLKGEKDK